MTLKFNRDGSVRPPTKKELNEAMTRDVGNWRRWENFYFMNKSRFSDPRRGMLVYLSTEFTISDAIVIRELIRLAAGSEENILWNGLAKQPFKYEEMQNYVSVMLFVCDENHRPTIEYLMLMFLEPFQTDSLCLDERDFEWRECLRCQYHVAWSLESLSKKRETARRFPKIAAEQIVDAWYELHNQEDNKTYADLGDVPYEVIESVAKQQGWKRIPERNSRERAKQGAYWKRHAEQLQRRMVRPPRLDKLDRKWPRLIADVQAFHRSF